VAGDRGKRLARRRRAHQTRLSTGPLTKVVSKKASEMTTESGGEVTVPSAVRSDDGTVTVG
jgi:hypothetical protein